MRKVYGKYLLALLLFGANGIVASGISMGSYEIVLLRTLIGSLFLLAVFFLCQKPWTAFRHKRALLYLAVSGVAMGASWMFLYEAYQQIGVGVASILYYCGPVIVMALAPLLFQERLTLAKCGSFAAVLCGVFLVNGQALTAGRMGWGILCGGMSAVFYAVMVICNKKAAAITGLENAALQLLAAFLCVLLFVGCKQGLALHIPTGDWGPIFVLGFVNTGIGCYLYFSSIGRLPVQAVAICGYLEPLSAVLLSILLLRESMLPLQLLGAALILGGAAFGESIGIRRKSPRNIDKTA